MRGITRDCAAELTSRKIIWLYAIVAILMIGAIVVTGKYILEPGQIDAGDVGARNFFDFRAQRVTYVLWWFLWVYVGLTTLVTAGQFPSMLSPGRAEFYLSKPISRKALYFNKLLGMLITYGALIAVCGLVGWATIYVVFSYSTVNFLYMIAINVFSLFIWLVLTSFGGVVFGSTSMAIIVAGVVFVAQLVLQARDFAKQLIDSSIIDSLIDVLYYVVPKMGELSDLSLDMALGRPVSNWMPAWTSLLFALVIISITSAVFKRRNY